MFYRFSALLFIVISTFTYATNLRCRLGYAYLNGVNSSIANVGDTYSQIFNELGDNFKPADFQIMLDSGKPFELPTTVKLSSETLSNTLKEFSELVRASGLNPDEVNNALLGELKKRITNQNKTESEQKKIHVRENFPSLIRYPEGYLNYLRFSPDGKDLIGSDNSHKFWISENWGAFKPIGSKIEHRYRGISTDGSYLFLSRGESPLDLFRIKLKDSSGKHAKTWESELWHHREQNREYDHENFSNFDFSENGKWVSAELGNAIHVFSTQNPIKNKSKSIFPCVAQIRVSRFIPRQENIIMFSSEKIYQFDIKGKELTTPVELKWESGDKGFSDFSFHDDLLVLNQGLTKAYTIDVDKGLLDIDLKTGMIKVLPALNGTGIQKAGFVSVRLDANGKYALVLVKTKNKKSHIITFDLDANKMVKNTEVPFENPYRIFLSPNHNVTLIADSMQGLKLYNTADLLP